MKHSGANAQAEARPVGYVGFRVQCGYYSGYIGVLLGFGIMEKKMETAMEQA